MQTQEMILADGTRLLPVHFVFMLDGRWRIACTPGLVELYAFGGRPFPWQRTEDSRAVSCPVCKETEEYRRAASLTDAATRSGRVSV